MMRNVAYGEMVQLTEELDRRERQQVLAIKLLIAAIPLIVALIVIVTR